MIEVQGKGLDSRWRDVTGGGFAVSSLHFHIGLVPRERAQEKGGQSTSIL